VEETRALVVAAKKRRRKARVYVGQHGQRIVITTKICEAAPTFARANFNEHGTAIFRHAASEAAGAKS